MAAQALEPMESLPSATVIGRAVERAIALYPEGLRAGQEADRERLRFQLGLVAARAPAGGRVMDVGGGIGAFPPALAFAGFAVTLVDDFADPVNADFPIERLGVHDQAGVRVVSVDASTPAFAPEPASYDVITCIDSIEHWHRSPKASLHKMVAALKPGGSLIVGMPNGVNLRKRITVPLGRGKWSPMEAWYEEPEFRSHVREPDVDDLRYIAGDLGLADVRIVGRNWAGMASANALVRRLARVADPLLRMRPTLCSDLYLIGRRPAQTGSTT